LKYYQIIFFKTILEWILKDRFKKRSILPVMMTSMISQNPFYEKSMIIFDLDDTLVCTDPIYKKWVINEAMKRVTGHDGISLQQVNMLWYETDRDGILETEFNVDPNKFWPALNNIDNPLRVKHTKVYDDVHYLLKLKEEGLKLGVMSGAPSPIVRDEVDLIVNSVFRGQNIFDIVVCSGFGGGFPAKPNPAGLEYCISSQNASKQGSIMVGNGDEDIRVGAAAGLKTFLLDRADRKDYPYVGRDSNVKPDIRADTLYYLGKELGF
jgi:FMN phosphatase YigB (HAD superfamily)